MNYLNPVAGAQREGRQAEAIDDLELTASGEYDDVELQAVSDKVDEILAALRTVGLIAPGEEE